MSLWLRVVLSFETTKYPEIAIRVSHKHTKLAMFALLPTLCLEFSSLFASTDACKFEIWNQGIHETYISRLHALMDWLIFNSREKIKLTMLAFLCCQFAKDYWFTLVWAFCPRAFTLCKSKHHKFKHLSFLDKFCVKKVHTAVSYVSLSY